MGAQHYFTTWNKGDKLFADNFNIFKNFFRHLQIGVCVSKEGCRVGLKMNFTLFTVAVTLNDFNCRSLLKKIYWVYADPLKRTEGNE